MTMHSTKLIVTLLIILAVSSIVHSGGFLDTLKKGAKAVKSLVDKVFPTSKAEICKARDSKLFDQITSLKCFESHAKKLSKSETYTSCWNKFIKYPHPATDQQWIEFYCSIHHHQMYKNIADHCFVRELALNGTILKEQEMDSKKCTSVLSAVYDSLGIPIDEKDDNQTIIIDPKLPSHLIDCRLEKNAGLFYCKRTYKKIADLCVKNDTNKIDNDMKAWTCYERELVNAPKGMESLNECWTLVTGTPYPTDQKAFLNFTCNVSFPHAFRPLVKKCLEELNQIGYKDLKRLKANCKKDFYALSDILVTMELQRAFKHQLQAKARQTMCSSIDPGKYVESNKTSPIKCMADTFIKQAEETALKYCFWAASLEGKDLPTTDREWYDYNCPGNFSSLLAVSQDKQISTCFQTVMEGTKMKPAACA